MALEIDQPINTVTLRESFDFAFPMLVNALSQIIGHACVKRAIPLACQDVHEIEMLALHVLGSRIGR